MRVVIFLLMATTTSGSLSLLSGQTPMTAKMVAAGGEVFAGDAGCKMCHGADAKGIKNMTGDMTDAEWKFATGGTLEALVKAIKQGVSSEKSGGLAMPAFGDKLTDDQVKAAAAYILSLGPKPAAKKAE
jgi:cbb3-type cytochrome c oxidase subunit III